jgi:tetratricopeptide (TPR) repeat protein
MTRAGKVAEGEAYYHRAIYGKWAGNASERRVSARMELIDLLAMRNQKQELLAELISLEADSPANLDIKRRLADLFLQAGAPGRAANVYGALAAKDPHDIRAYEGLGEAELEQGEYRAAHEAFLRASRVNPTDKSLQANLQTISTVTGLDPTQRQLTSAEKYRRSVRILNMVRTLFDECAARNPPGTSALNSAENRDVLRTADAMTGGKAPPRVTNEAAEGVLSIAEKLWHAEKTACPANRAGIDALDQSALDLIMRKIAS